MTKNDYEIIAKYTITTSQTNKYNLKQMKLISRYIYFYHQYLSLQMA